jgi:hypothetical protein
VANPFDVFDAPQAQQAAAPAPARGGNPFDQFDMPNRAPPPAPAQPSDGDIPFPKNFRGPTAADIPPNLATPTSDIPSLLPAMGRALDDTVRSVASGATFGLADEGAAAAKTLFGDKGYSENLAAERKRDSEIPWYIKYPGEIAGGVATGTGLARSGVTLLNTANPTIGNMALRGAGEGAAYGAVHGFGNGEGAQGRVEGAAKGALIGTVTGGATGAIAGKMAQRSAEKAIPSTEGLRDAATKNYDEARAAGVLIDPKSFGNAVDTVETAARSAGINDKLHPDATAAIDYLRNIGSKPLRLEDVDTLRQIVKDVADPRNKPGEQRIGAKMVEALDDYLGKLGPTDVLAGDATKAVETLNTARDFWTRFRKSELIDGIAEKAQNAASGYENGLRAGFRSLANNEKEMARFSPEEQDAIKRVVRGGTMENVTKLVGKLAPTGVVSGGISAAVGNAIGGAPGSIILPAIGAGARSAATAATGRSADAVSSLVRSGGAMPPGLLGQDVLRGLLIGESQEGPGLLNSGKRYLFNTAR